MRRRRQIVLCTMLAIAALVAGNPRPSHADDVSPGRGSPTKPEDPDYTLATKAIKAEDFAAAIQLLEKVVARDGTNADAYNLLAYAVRRNGDPASSLPIYGKALAIDPKHRGAHEYMGEAYLALDDIAKAKEHLAALNRLCFFPCSQYRDLKNAIEAYEKSGGKVKPRAAR